jgi:hypothetical protein
MHVILTVGLVSLITCSLAVPVPAPPQPGHITLVQHTNFLNQNKVNAPNAVFNANGKRVRVFRSFNKGHIFIFYLQEHSVVLVRSDVGSLLYFHFRMLTYRSTQAPKKGKQEQDDNGRAFKDKQKADADAARDKGSFLPRPLILLIV